MAGGDYKSCDVCKGKTFYDANLDYDTEDDEWNKHRPWTKEVGAELEKFWKYKLAGVGDWAVLCPECTKTHKTQIVPIEG